jgi:hypothetical protein
MLRGPESACYKHPTSCPTGITALPGVAPFNRAKLTFYEKPDLASVVETVEGESTRSPPPLRPSIVPSRTRSTLYQSLFSGFADSAVAVSADAPSKLVVDTVL